MNAPKLSYRPSRQTKGSSPSTFRKCQKKLHEVDKKEFFAKRINKIKGILIESNLSFDQYVTEKRLLTFLDGIGAQIFDR